MGDNPGFSKSDLARTKTKAEMQAIKREFDAFETYIRCGYNLEAAAGELGIEAGPARVLVNRGERRFWQHRTKDLDEIRAQHLMELQVIRKPLAQAGAGGHNQSAMDLLKVQERESKLLGLDAQKDAPDGPQIIVVDTRMPWERGEVIEGEVAEDPKPLPDAYGDSAAPEGPPDTP